MTNHFCKDLITCKHNTHAHTHTHTYIKIKMRVRMCATKSGWKWNGRNFHQNIFLKVTTISRFNEGENVSETELIIPFSKSIPRQFYWISNVLKRMHTFHQYTHFSSSEGHIIHDKKVMIPNCWRKWNWHN